MKQTISLEQLRNKAAKVKLSHKIYGTDTVYLRNFQPIVAEDKVGFIFQGREIFLHNEEIKEIEIRNHLYIITGKLLTIHIQIV